MPTPREIRYAQPRVTNLTWSIAQQVLGLNAEKAYYKNEYEDDLLRPEEKEDAANWEKMISSIASWLIDDDEMYKRAQGFKGTKPTAQEFLQSPKGIAFADLKDKPKSAVTTLLESCDVGSTQAQKEMLRRLSPSRTSKA